MHEDTNSESSEYLLEARNLSAGYGDVAAIRDIDLGVAPGEIVALFGANGAGKTTTLTALVGGLDRMSGSVHWRGNETGASLHQLVRDGLAFVPEERSVLMSMTVRDNLRLGSGGVDRALDIFPALEAHLDKRAGLLSGGEQQMLTLGRALATEPSVLLIDELSLGLSPIAVERLFVVLRESVRRNNIAVLLVEQEARRALDVADRWYLMRHGEIVMAGDSQTGAKELEAEYLTGAQRG